MTTHEEDEGELVPSLETTDVNGQRGVVLYPPLLTDRPDTTDRVLDFAEAWGQLRACRWVAGDFVEFLHARQMLLPPRKTPK